ncbi:MAG: ATP-dependent RNA helicase dbp6 [Sclerophora amabilis]|nr:MAG: ATP-dependent RNA helicase dbp6 [Sclerophora amabilis]
MYARYIPPKSSVDGKHQISTKDDNVNKKRKRPGAPEPEHSTVTEVARPKKSKQNQNDGTSRAEQNISKSDGKAETTGGSEQLRQKSRHIPGTALKQDGHAKVEATQERQEKKGGKRKDAKRNWGPDLESGARSALSGEVTPRKQKRKERALDHDAVNEMTDMRGQKNDKGTKALPKLEVNRTDSVHLVSEGAGQETSDASKHKSVYAKYQRSALMAQKLAQDDSTTSDSDRLREGGIEDNPDLRGLEPFPQPEQVPDAPFKPNYSALPFWLANPITVSSEDKISFQELPLDSRAVDILQSKGFKEASAVQSAILPLLLPGPNYHKGDLCISAPTGSGKTLAYVLPIIESLRTRVVTRLKALIIVPTRELVTQARQMCELCASGSGLKIGTALGSRSLKAERELLISKEQKYDPLGYERWEKESTIYDEETGSNSIDYEINADHEALPLPGHVYQYSSKVDVLISTPGRLVDHLQATSGFTLDFVQWLVIDEADRLLGQSFQDWLDILMGRLDKEKSYEEMSVDQQLLCDMGMDFPPTKKQAQKLILSATMTRDLEKLNGLKLWRPKFVVVDNVKQASADSSKASTEAKQQEADPEERFDLPPNLREQVVPVGDAAEKPLYLLNLLRTKLSASNSQPPARDGDSSNGSDDSEQSNDSSSSESSSTSASLSSSSILTTPTREENAGSQIRARSDNGRSQLHGVLIFTRSNESALRLTRLLTLLQPMYTKQIGTLTSTHRTSERRKTLRSFLSSQLSVLVASDLVARGMDIPNLAHIVNYDVPSSVRGYVHRVGRAARADRDGDAWTLVADREAAWFWREIAKGDGIRRREGRKIQRVKLDIAGDHEGREAYRRALEVLGDEVRGGA